MPAPKPGRCLPSRKSPTPGSPVSWNPGIEPDGDVCSFDGAHKRVAAGCEVVNHTIVKIGHRQSGVARREGRIRFHSKLEEASCLNIVDGCATRAVPEPSLIGAKVRATLPRR